MENNVYVIIVTYNATHWLGKCLNSIPQEYNVIIVDNGSSDKTCQFIEEQEREYILLKQNKNLGFGQANNIGISEALQLNADFVFLLNQDAYLEENTISNLLKIYFKNSNIGLLSPIHLTASKNKLDKGFSNYINNSNCPDLLIDAFNNALRDYYEVPFINAAGWLIPKKTLLKIGGFDPIFFHYGEDNNYCSRLLFHSLKIVFVPNSRMVHDREFRKISKMNIKDPAYLARYESNFKSKYSDVNTNMIYNKSHWNRALFIKLLSLDFTGIRAIFKLKKQEIQWFKECILSKHKNRTESFNYLNIKKND